MNRRLIHDAYYITIRSWLLRSLSPGGENSKQKKLKKSDSFAKTETINRKDLIVFFSVFCHFRIS